MALSDWRDCVVDYGSAYVTAWRDGTLMVKVLESIAWSAVATVTAFAFVVCTSFARLHAREHSGYHFSSDSEIRAWYQGLKQPLGGSCCDISDCHATEAEIRKDQVSGLPQWWARVGYIDKAASDRTPLDADGKHAIVWVLGPMVPVPDGKPVNGKTNPHREYNVIILDQGNRVGEAVICHEPAAMDSVQPNGIAKDYERYLTIYCFVPGALLRSREDVLPVELL